MKSVMQVIESRRSIRRYTAEPIADETLERLLHAAVCAPSGKNLQPWAFAIVRDRETVLRLASLMRYSRFLETAPCVIAVYKVSARCYAQSKDDMAIGAAIQNMLLCAADAGIGACWIGENIEQADRLLSAVFATQGCVLEALLALGDDAGVSEEDRLTQPVRRPAVLLKRRVKNGR